MFSEVLLAILPGCARNMSLSYWKIGHAPLEVFLLHFLWFLVFDIMKVMDGN